MILRLLLLTLGLAPALPAAAKTFCCTDPSGRQVCGDPLPAVCYDRGYKEMSDQGRVRRTVEPPLTPEQRVQREEELRLKKEEQKRLAEEDRRNRALLNTYGSETDIDYMRDRALADVDKAVKQAQEKYAEALKRKLELDNEAEFYKKKQMPPELISQIKANNVELQAHQAAVAAKQKDIDAIRQKYDEEKRRYILLTRGPGALNTLPTNPATPPAGGNGGGPATPGGAGNVPRPR